MYKLGEGQLTPGGAIGILGGGQLGGFTAVAAKEMGYHPVVYAPAGDNPAFRHAQEAIVGRYDDRGALGKFIDALGSEAVVTAEFENVPLCALHYLEKRKVAVAPSSRVMKIAQDRLLEKQLALALAINTTPWVAYLDPTISRNAEQHLTDYLPGILKTRREGYDGKGQRRVATPEECGRAWEEMGRVPCILERVVDIDYEFSIIVARNTWGKDLYFPAVLNRHEEGILRETIYEPGSIRPNIDQGGRLAAFKLMTSQALNVAGLLAVEFFVTRQGRLLFNEMAPRPHNSGHWTIEGCQTSQYTALLQAICGLEFTPVQPARRARMVNLLGEDIHTLHLHKGQGAFVHDYGKSKNDIPQLRKMGHATYIDKEVKRLARAVGA